MSEEDFSQGEQKQVKKSFNWRWMFTHLLPIFLVLIIGTVITVASVPSFRNSFNRFIAKWSPKADTTSSDSYCSGVSVSDSTAASGRSDMITISASPKILNIGDILTLTANVTASSYGENYGRDYYVGISIPLDQLFTIQDLKDGIVSFSPQSDFGCNSKIKLGKYWQNTPEHELDLSLGWDALEEKYPSGQFGSIFWTTSKTDSCSAITLPSPSITLKMRNATYGTSYIDKWLGVVGHVRTSYYNHYGYTDYVYYCNAPVEQTEQIGTPEVLMYLDKTTSGGSVGLEGQQATKISEDTISESYSLGNTLIDDTTEVYKGDTVSVHVRYENTNSSTQTVNLKAVLDDIDNFDISDISDSGSNSNGTFSWSNIAVDGKGIKDVTFKAKIKSGKSEVGSATDLNLITVQSSVSSGTTSKDGEKESRDYLLPVTSSITIIGEFKDPNPVYPGSKKVQYQLYFENENIESLKDFDMIVRLPSFSNPDGNYYQDSERTINANNVVYNNTDKLIKISVIELASQNSSGIQDLYFDVTYGNEKNEVPFIFNNTAIGQDDVEFKQMKTISYWRKDLTEDSLYYRVNPSELNKKDLSGVVKGKIIGPYDPQGILRGSIIGPQQEKGVPRVYIGLLTKQSDTDTTYKLAPSAQKLLTDGKYSEFADNYYSKEDGNKDKDGNIMQDGQFSADFNRMTDVTNYESVKDSSGNITKKFKIKYEVVYRDYKDTSSVDTFKNYTLGLFTNPGNLENSTSLTGLEQLYFRTESFDIASTKLTTKNVDIKGTGEPDPKWEYPTQSTDQQYLKRQTIVAAEVYTNLRKAKRFLDNDIKLSESDDGRSFPLPQTKVVFDYSGTHFAYYKDKTQTIYLGEASQQLQQRRNAQMEFHEYGHLVLKYVLGKWPNWPVTAKDDKIPYAPEANNHQGYLNDSTADSLNEGFADFMQVWLDKKVGTSKNWTMLNLNGTVDGNLDILYPISPSLSNSNPLSITNLNDISATRMEEIAVAETFKELISGIPIAWSNKTIAWLGGKTVSSLDFSLLPIKKTGDNNPFKSLVEILRDTNIATLSDLYSIVAQDFDPSDPNLARYKENINNLAILHGVFADQNCNAVYDAPDETAGLARTDNGFIWTMPVPISKDESKTVSLDSRQISLYLSALLPLDPKSANASSKPLQITTPTSWPFKSGTVGSRYWRYSAPELPGSYVKFNFNDAAGKLIQTNKVKVDIQFDQPYQDFNYSYEIYANSGEDTYITLPFSIYNTKAVITSEGSSDSMVINSDNYWQAINTGQFGYLAEKEIKVDGSIAPTFDVAVKNDESTKKEAVVAKTALSLSLIDTKGNPISKVSGGDTIKIEANGFTKSSKIKVYIGSAQIDEVPFFGGKFAYKVVIPENVMVGPTKIRLVGDQSEQISSNTFWVISNKWFNLATLSLSIIIIFLMVFCILGIRKLIIYKLKLGAPHSNMLSILVFLGMTSILFFAVSRAVAITDMEYSALNKTTWENSQGFIRLPKSSGDNYIRVEPYYEQWAKPKTICFIQRLTKKWNDQFSGTDKDKYKLTINDLSLPGGGSFPPHSLHQKGLSIDLYNMYTIYANYPYYPTDPKEIADYKGQKFLELLANKEFITDFGIKNVYYGNPKLIVPATVPKGIFKLDADHRDHWHIELNP